MFKRFDFMSAFFEVNSDTIFGSINDEAVQLIAHNAFGVSGQFSGIDLGHGSTFVD